MLKHGRLPPRQILIWSPRPHAANTGQPRVTLLGIETRLWDVAQVFHCLNAPRYFLVVLSEDGTRELTGQDLQLRIFQVIE